MRNNINFRFALLLFILLVFSCDVDKSRVPNIAPTANAGLDQSVKEQTIVSLYGSGNDSDGSIESYHWSQTSGNPVVFFNSNSNTAVFTSPIVTTITYLSFELTVTDNGGLSTTDSVVVTVTPINAAPIADAGLDQSVNEQSTVTLYGSGTDSDGSIESYSWSQTAGISVSFSEHTSNTLNFTAPMVETNSYLSFELTVTDNEGMTSTDSVVVIINVVGNIIYVPNDFLKISDAINSAVSGDKVILNKVTHVETGEIYIDKDLIIASTFIFTQDPSDILNSVIRGDGKNNLFTATDGASVQIVGLTIENTRKPITIDTGYGAIRYNVLRDNNSDSISFEENSSGIVEFNEISNSGDDGIDIDGSRGPYSINGNIITGSADDGMEFRMLNHYLVAGKIMYEVYDNIIDGAKGDGIQLIDYPEDNQNLREIKIHNNYIKNVMYAGVGSMPDKMTLRAELAVTYPLFAFKEKVILTNNTLINNDNGISGGENFIILNNIVSDNRLGATNLYANSVIDYTMFFKNNLYSVPDHVQREHIVFDDPRLNSDGSLHYLSPCIDAGVSNYIWQNETVLNIKKFNGVSPDLGWLEF